MISSKKLQCELNRVPIEQVHWTGLIVTKTESYKTLHALQNQLFSEV
jgi:hypothetical protein